MKYWLLIFLFMFFKKGSSQEIPGNWYGVVNTEDGPSRIVLTIYQEKGVYKGAISMPDFLMIGRELHFDSVMINKANAYFSFQDKIKVIVNAITDSTIKGSFSSSVPYLHKGIVLKKVNQFPNLNKPQTPVRPFPYVSRSIQYFDSITMLSYKGVLTMPTMNPAATSEKFPVVVLLPGTGIHDKDYTSGAHKYFLVLADYLTRQGYAVLRKDSRGLGDTSTNQEQITLPQLVDDAAAALRMLHKLPQIDTTNIGFLGHSEGGMVAPALAAKNNSVKFIVLLAAPGILYKDLLNEQSTTLNANSKLPEIFLKDTSFAKRMMAAIRNNSPRLNFLYDYDPTIALSKLAIPVLALNGDKDVVINAKTNIAGIEKALQRAGNKNYKALILPELNHNFQKCVTCTYQEGFFLDETMAPDVLTIIGEWLNENIKSKK